MQALPVTCSAVSSPPAKIDNWPVRADTQVKDAHESRNFVGWPVQQRRSAGCYSPPGEACYTPGQRCYTLLRGIPEGPGEGVLRAGWCGERYRPSNDSVSSSRSVVSPPGFECASAPRIGTSLHDSSLGKWNETMGTSETGEKLYLRLWPQEDGLWNPMSADSGSGQCVIPTQRATKVDPMEAGSRTRIYEIPRRSRPLPLGMIRRLHERLHIPAEVLMRPESQVAQSLVSQRLCGFSDWRYNRLRVAPTPPRLVGPVLLRDLPASAASPLARGNGV
jgi:hypothetical protein